MAIRSRSLSLGLLAAACLVVGGSAAHAALNKWSANYGSQCDSSNAICCKADALVADYAWSGLWQDSNSDGVPPWSITTNNTFKVRGRAKCNGSGSFTTSVWSQDNKSCNQSGKCTTSTGWEVSLVQCPNNAQTQCMLATQ